MFLEVASIRLAAMEKDAVKVIVVYESMFGNTRKVAEAISDGVREAYPDAHVECVAVGRAAAELLWFTDLLIVGGPTHRRRMTTDASRNRHISREKKAQAKGERPRELEPDAEGPGLRKWLWRLPQAKKRGHAAAFDTRRGSALAGGAGHVTARKLRGHGYELVKYSEGLHPGCEVLRRLHPGWRIWGRFVPARSSARRRGELSWCGRASPTPKAGRSGTS